MDDEQTMLICQRVAVLEDPPVQSVIATCAKCLDAVWCALSSPEVDVIMCPECAAEEIIKTHGGFKKLEPLTEAQLAELRWWRTNFG